MEEEFAATLVLGGVGAEVPRAELLARWQDHGSCEALDLLLQQEVRAIKRRLRHEVRNAMCPDQSASDVAQEAAARLLGTRFTPHFASPAALRAYLWTAALNLARRRLQERTHRSLPSNAIELAIEPSTSGDGAESLLASERSAALHVALALLPPNERRILELVYFAGQDPREAARSLAIEPENARMRLTRARRALACKLRVWKEVVEGE